MTAPAIGPRFVDLHAHTTASDGTATPTTLVERAKAAGLAAIAVTDHDTVGGAAEARETGARVGIEVVVGTELSATEGADELHILALHIDDVAVIERALARFRDGRVSRAEAMVERLAALGAPVTLADVLAEAAGGAVGRPHVARALVARKAARDIRDAFDRFLGAGRPAYVPKEQLAIADAVRIAHEAGAIAVAAHLGGDGRRDYVERLRRLGLDGLEVRHPGHSSEDILRLGALADHFGMVKSGGSDWHGATEGTRVLGAMRVPGEWLDQQRERAEAIRRGRAGA